MVRNAETPQHEFDNILCSFPHAAWGGAIRDIMPDWREQLFPTVETGQKTLYLRNFSDWITRRIADVIGDSSKVVSKNPRLLGDLNRPVESDSFIPLQDFGGVEVWSDGAPSAPLRQVAEYNHQQYFDQMDELIAHLEDTGSPFLVADIHDTHPKKLNAKGEWENRTLKNGEIGFPKVLLSTLDGESCDPEVLEMLKESILKYFKEEGLELQDEINGLEINTEYKGGYITKRLSEKRKVTPNLNAVQIELDRSLYANDDQVIERDGLAKVQQALIAALQEVDARLSR